MQQLAVFDDTSYFVTVGSSIYGATAVVGKLSRYVGTPRVSFVPEVLAGVFSSLKCNVYWW